MAVDLSTPDVTGIAGVLAALASWQRDDAPIQLHPGDLGWAWRLGADPLAAAVRTWSRDGQLLCIGYLDEPGLIRLTVAPEVWDEQALAEQVLADLSDPHRGVLPAGRATVESPDGTRVQRLLDERGWQPGDPWTPLQRDLAEPVVPTGLRVEAVDPADPTQVADYAGTVRSAFDSTGFTPERWQTMAAGPAFADGVSLLGRDDRGVPVVGITVWSAGPGRPGLIEPMGVRADQRRQGYGRAICLAGAAALRELGASSALVCTPSPRAGAADTYASAGFTRLPERLDRTRTS